MNYLLLAVLCLLSPAFCLLSAQADTYQQTFDSLTDGVTISGSDSWILNAGETDNAVISSGDTAEGSGKSLKLTGALTPVDVSRSAVYSGLSPTWIEYVVKAGIGSDERDVPTEGIAAVNFSPTGNIMVSDGANWVNSGKAYSTSTWYRIILKVDFSAHLYDVYIENAGTPKAPFVPNKENLHFIDPAVSSMSQIGFMGAYNARSQADSLVDEVVVHAVDKLQFITSPQTMVKGYSSGLITAQLQNANSEPQTAWKDMTFEMRSSTQAGEFSLDKENWVPIKNIILPLGAQQVSFYYKDFAEGRPTISVNEFPDRGWTDATQEEKIVKEGDFFAITTTTPQVAGVPFQMQITAMDGQGGVDTSYSGNVNVFVQYVSPTNGTKILAPDSTGGFVLGVKDLTVTYPDAGTVKLAVQDASDTEKIGYSGDVVFVPNSFEVSTDPAQIVGRNFVITVKALEAGGGVASNYQGPARMEPVPSLEGAVLNPSELTVGSFQNGIVLLGTSFNRWGTFAFKAVDQQDATKIGTSAAVKFLPKSISINVKKPSETRNFFYVAENMEITVSILGEDGLPIENFQGTVSITPTPSFDISSQYVFSPADKGQKKFVVPAGHEGTYQVKVQDVENNLTAESESFDVKDATIQISSVSSPVGSTVVEIQLVDSKGQRIKNENEMTFTVAFEESNENGTIFFSELGKPILFKKGVAKIVIGDSEAEEVTITARSSYGLKVINGKISFGRAGPAGVGTLMLREKKD